MGKFTFRLATLLRVRENDRRRCRAELAQARRADAILARRQEQLNRRRDELRARCREAAGPGRLDVETLVELGRHNKRLAAQEDELRQQRQVAMEEINRRRAALVVADHGVQVLQKLEAKRRDQHDQHETRRDIKKLDEIAATCRAAQMQMK